MKRRKRKKITSAQRDIKTLQYATKAQSFQRKVPRATVGYQCKKPSVDGFGASAKPYGISYDKWMKEIYGF